MKYDPDILSLLHEANYLHSDRQRRISWETWRAIQHQGKELQGLRDSIRAQHKVIEEVTR